MLIAVAACGGPADAVSGLAEIVPAAAEVGPGETLKFATDPDESVGWDVLEPDGGVIDATGLYTAPDLEGDYTVAASTLAGVRTTPIRVNRKVRVEISPSTVTLARGESVSLEAVVNNTSDTAVLWSVAQGAAGGTISAAGVYTAPQSSGTFTVVASSVADPRRSDSATITVVDAPAPEPQPEPTPTVAIAVSPQAVSVLTGNSVQLVATVTGSTDAGVTWSVTESGGGSVSSTGLYTAPTTPGSYHVVATSHADPSRTSSAAVTVTSPVVSRPVIASFTASPATVTQGASTTLSWAVSGATSLTLDNGVGPVTGLTSKSIAPSATTRYMLTATNAAGSVTATVNVTVNAPVPPTTDASLSGVAAAYPGAQGGGALSKGGRGGAVIEVTNLNDTGAGSLRACIDAVGPRTCVFRVSGTISLNSTMYVWNPYLTVAGQTAPGGGIQLSGKNMASGDMVVIHAHDVVWQYTRLRQGYNPGRTGNSGGAFSIFNLGYNVVLDHNSISWSSDDMVLVYSNVAGEGARDLTISSNLLGEPLSAQSTPVGAGASTPSGNDATTNVDFQRNLLTTFSHRGPMLAVKRARFVNNIVYNWGYWASLVQGGIELDMIGNIWKAGPSSSSVRELRVYPNNDQGGSSSTTPSIYMAGNKGPNNPDPASDNWTTMARQINTVYGSIAELGAPPTSYRRMSPLPAAGVAITPTSATNLEAELLPSVGASRRLDCNGNWVANRDSADARMVSNYQNRLGFIPISETDVGGMPALAAGTPCPDTDHDGMPDAWETARGLNPANAADRSAYAAGVVYTNLERYLAGR
jgi:pectate lyase